VQRYLSGKSITQSRLSLLFNALAKIPMQFVILFTGAMVFVFYLYQQPPLLFQPVEFAAGRGAQRVPAGGLAVRPGLRRAETGGRRLRAARRSGDAAVKRESLERYRRAEREIDQARERGLQLARENRGDRNFSDTNYIFLAFVTRYMPAGIVGLILAVIFAATMSSIAAEFNSLATVLGDRYLTAAHPPAGLRPPLSLAVRAAKITVTTQKAVAARDARDSGGRRPAGGCAGGRYRSPRRWPAS